MVRFLVATNDVKTSESLVEYLETRATDGDVVYVVNSLVGGDDTDDKDVFAGRDAIEYVEDTLSDSVTVETHQLVRGNTAAEDIQKFAADKDVNEIVIGIRKRSPTGKVVFGSNAQDILLSSERPVVAVPLSE
ncbi:MULTISPECIES: universal stress protein [unclassified Haladaptatus]|uniref:universal stress protein n=1 Tax=unclassified Haladaptatus TaxID=2622732 RepID=UPI0023E78270|nr:MULTISPECIES: universal stress protein [unclassified Haladaptatus]